MIALYLLLGVLVFLTGCFLFDDFIEYQHEHYKNSWVRDGRPRGYGFSPKGGSYLSMWKISLERRTEPPAWAKNDKVAQEKFRRLTVFNKIWKWYLILLFPVLVVGVST